MGKNRNAAGIVPAISKGMARIDQYFKFMKEQNASDLHLSTGNPPILRIHGEMVRIDAAPFGSDDLKALSIEELEKFRVVNAKIHLF